MVPLPHDIRGAVPQVFLQTNCLVNATSRLRREPPSLLLFMHWLTRGVQAYPVRQAMIEVLGILIRDRAASLDESEDKKKTMNEIASMFDTILDRILDNNSYVRATIFKVLTKVCESGAQNIGKLRLKITSHAVMALEDKSASVRKAAITLLIQLLETHPFGVLTRHKGKLRRDEFMKDYDEAKAQLQQYESLGDAVANPEDEDSAGEEKR